MTSKHPHYVTWKHETYGPFPEGSIVGKITCEAEEGARCRLTCPDGCESFEFDGHEHKLVDYGSCVQLEWIENGDLNVAERYIGAADVPVHDGPVELEWNDDTYWKYLVEPVG